MTRLKILMISMVFLLAFSGCRNFSPRMDQRISNENGRIDEIKNNQNGLMSEIELLKNQSEIQNSKLDKVQQGMANYQNHNENHGVQILSGSGGIALVAVFMICSTILIVYYRNKAIQCENTSRILAEKIVEADDPKLEDSVFKAVMYTKMESKVYNLIKKYKNKK